MIEKEKINREGEETECMNFFLLLNSVGKAVDPFDFHSMFCSYYGSEWVQSTV